MTDSRTYACNRHSLRHDGKRYGLGDPVPLTEAQAKPLLASGAVTDVNAAAEAQQTFTPTDPQEGVTTLDANPDPTDDDAFVDPLEGQDSDPNTSADAADETDAASPASAEADDSASTGAAQASRETAGDAAAQDSTPASAATPRATKRVSKRAG